MEMSDSFENPKNDDCCRACMIYFNRESMVFLYESTNVAEIFSKCTSLEV